MPTLHPKIKKVNWLIRTFSLIIFFGIALNFYIIFDYFKEQRLTIAVFDVGQGDSIFIRTSNRADILIDGGPDNKIIYKLPKIMPWHDRQIDFIILTHPHADHLTGLLEVVERYEIENIITTGLVYDSELYFQWQKLIKEKEIKIFYVDEPKIIDLGQEKLYFIQPEQNLVGQTSKNINNASIVFLLKTASTSALFMGDFEKEETFDFNNQVNFLKVSHHGASNGNSLNFLEKISPDLAAISVGQNNRYGHPQTQALNNLAEVSANIYRTDQLGDLFFRLNQQGNAFEVLP